MRLIQNPTIGHAAASSLAATLFLPTQKTHFARTAAVYDVGFG